MVLYRLPGEGCADTPAKRRKSFHGGSTMASMPSTSAAVSTPEYSKEEFLSSICGFIHYLVKPSMEARRWHPCHQRPQPYLHLNIQKKSFYLRFVALSII